MRFSTILIYLILTLPFHAGAEVDVRKISVTGSSETTVDAHEAIVTISVRHVDRQMNQSHAALVETVRKLTKELLALGLEEKDIRKSLIHQGPEYAWENSTRVLKGYFSEITMDLVNRNISEVGKVYRELANYPSITIQRTVYKRNDESEIRKRELEKALITAKNKAEHMARVLNVKIGKIHSIQEVSDQVSPAVRLHAEAMQAETGALQGFGNITVTASVAVEFEIY